MRAAREGRIYCAYRPLPKLRWWPLSMVSRASLRISNVVCNLMLGVHGYLSGTLSGGFDYHVILFANEMRFLYG